MTAREFVAYWLLALVSWVLPAGHRAQGSVFTAGGEIDR
jgi:hypothetical protein